MAERLLFIVPAYNESASIRAVVEALSRHYPGAQVVVVNDGSTDATSRIARAAGADVLDLPYNLGIGGAVQSGFLFAAQTQADYAVQFDGDGQHLVSEVAKILERVRSGEADVAIGSRFIGDASFRPPLLRRLGIAIIAAVNSRLTGMRITDPTSGFRAFNRSAIAFLAEVYPHDFPEPESLVTLVRNGFRTCEVAVKMEARQGGTSSITVSRSVYYMLKVLLAIAIGATRKRSVRALPAAASERTPEQIGRNG